LFPTFVPTFLVKPHLFQLLNFPLHVL
jgi:hypothetical protein